MLIRFELSLELKHININNPFLFKLISEKNFNRKFLMD